MLITEQRAGNHRAPVLIKQGWSQVAHFLRRGRLNAAISQRGCPVGLLRGSARAHRPRAHHAPIAQSQAFKRPGACAAAGGAGVCVAWDSTVLCVGQIHKARRGGETGLTTGARAIRVAREMTGRAVDLAIGVHGGVVTRETCGTHAIETVIIPPNHTQAGVDANVVGLHALPAHRANVLDARGVAQTQALVGNALQATLALVIHIADLVFRADGSGRAATSAAAGGTPARGQSAAGGDDGARGATAR